MELSYRNLKVWHKSLNLIKSVYSAAEKLPKCEESNLTQRLRQSSVAVALNIAEGKGRKTAREFSGFLDISAACLHEVEAVLVICLELGYLKSIDEIHAEIASLAKLLATFKGSLNADAN